MKYVTAAGEEHGLINTLPNSNADDGFKTMKPEIKAKAEKLKKDECKIVKARYINHREKNGKLEKPYCHWAGEPIMMFRFLNGYTYEVPMGLVTEVNDTVDIKRSEILDSQGVPTKRDVPDHVHEFVPVSFVA